MISRRIKKLASFLMGEETIADVGTDHGYLIVESFLNYGIKKAYAIDNKEMPLGKAKENISKYEFSDKVEFILSNGLTELKKKVDAIVIAGMGGLLILDIFEKSLHRFKNAKLIIQANRNQYEIRKFLMENNYEIINEAIVEEAKQFYEIIVAKYSTKKMCYNELDLMFGPILRINKESTFKEKLLSELRILNKIDVKNNDITKKIKLIEEAYED